MGAQFLDVFLIMAVLLAFIAPGFVLRKTHLLTKSSLASLANILLYVCQPALSIKAFAVKPLSPSVDLTIGILWIVAASAAGILVMFGLGRLVFLRWRSREEANVYTFLGMFSNCSFVGVPFVDMLTDGDSLALMYTIVFSVSFNILLWTLGTYLITGERSAVSVRRALLNPSVIGIAIGMLLFYVPAINIFDMPSIAQVQQLVVYTGAATAPLSMIIVGARMADLKPRQLFGRTGVYLASAMRLVAAPLVMSAIMLSLRALGCFGSDPYLWMIPIVAMGLSPAATIVAFAEKYGKAENTAAAAFVTGTLLSIVTMPVLMVLLSL